MIECVFSPSLSFCTVVLLYSSDLPFLELLSDEERISQTRWLSSRERDETCRWLMREITRLADSRESSSLVLGSQQHD